MLLRAVRSGEESAAAALFEAVHKELRGLAGAVFRGAAPGQTLQPTALINEAWLRLAGGVQRVEDRRHFFALAARAMRHVLADHARSRSRDKRGGNAGRVSLSGEALAVTDGGIDLIDFNDSLDRLAEIDERLARVTELRVLGTLSISEIAGLLSVSERTVKRDWQVARLWLLKELRRS